MLIFQVSKCNSAGAQSDVEDVLVVFRRLINRDKDFPQVWPAPLTAVQP